MIEEIWKDVAGYENHYQVSDMGNVKRKENTKHQKSNTLKSSKHSKGYCRVNLCDGKSVKCFLVHRLVAIAFLGNPENKKEVNHKNGNKTDNRAENLEWVTRKENAIHAAETGLMNYENMIGEKNFLAKLTKGDIIYIRQNYTRGVTTQKFFAERFGVDRSIICRILMNKNWRWVK